jgi:FkbM family methyltransferase
MKTKINNSLRNDIKTISRNIIWKLTRPKNRLNRSMCKVARQYIASYNDFSYDFESNGELKLIQILSKHGLKNVFDVGANIGDWSEAALRLFPDAEFHCFELSPNTFNELRKNIKSERCHLNNFGLGAFDGDITYKDYGNCSGINTMLTNMTYHDANVVSSEVNSMIMRGSSYCTERKINTIDFLKIDVEGAESMVLEGFSQLLEKQAIKCIQFEYGYANGDAHFLMKDFYEMLGNHGYLVGKIWKNGVHFTPFNYNLNDFDSGPNFLAVLESEKDLISAVSSNPNI